MDWRNRKYYCVSFSFTSIEMRLNYLKLIKGIKMHPYRAIAKQPDEIEERGHYQYLLSVSHKSSNLVEFELRKAERNDGYCFWKEIEQVAEVR